MSIMTWMNRGPRIGVGMAEQMEWFTHLYTDLMQFSHGVDEPALVDAELKVEGIHLDWFTLTSILPHLDALAWPEDGRMKMVHQIMEDIEGISSITDEKQAEGSSWAHPMRHFSHALMRTSKSIVSNSGFIRHLHAGSMKSRPMVPPTMTLVSPKRGRGNTRLENLQDCGCEFCDSVS